MPVRHPLRPLLLLYLLPQHRLDRCLRVYVAAASDVVGASVFILSKFYQVDLGYNGRFALLETTRSIHNQNMVPN